METVLLPDCTVSNAEGSNFYYRKISQGDSRKAKNTSFRKTGLRAENINVNLRKRSGSSSHSGPVISASTQ